jgi:hypothetical protein
MVSVLLYLPEGWLHVFQTDGTRARKTPTTRTHTHTHAHTPKVTPELLQWLGEVFAVTGGNLRINNSWTARQTSATAHP